MFGKYVMYGMVWYISSVYEWQAKRLEEVNIVRGYIVQVAYLYCTAIHLSKLGT